MTILLYQHPLSSYCHKAKTGFYEKGVAFETRMLDRSEPTASEFAALWPIGKFPVAVDDGKTVFEATSIIEHLEVRFPEPRLIPADPALAAEVRMWDRFFDNYVSYPQQRLVARVIGVEPDEGTDGARWKAALDTAYALLDQRMAGRTWAVGEAFSLADCAAAPALLYADWSHRIPERFGALHAYRRRLLERPSYARALDEARPYRHMFPLDAPTDRD